MDDKRYQAGTSRVLLGDGVYVEVKDGVVRLTTTDGLVTLNEIYLEPEVLEEFLRYVGKRTNKKD